MNLNDHVVVGEGVDAEPIAAFHEHSMIPLVPAENDDAEFLLLVQRIASGAISALELGEVYLVRIDNWFDHKWLGWRSPWRHKQIEKLRIPTFTPNRVRSEQRFDWESETST